MKSAMNKTSLLVAVIFIVTFNCFTSSERPDLVEYLASLGKSLEARLSQPGKESEFLLRDLFDYYNNLNEIYENVTSENETLKKEGLDIVQGIIEDGGPPHLNVEVDFDEFLFKVFKNDRDTGMIDKIIKYNRETWEKLKLLYEKHAKT